MPVAFWGGACSKVWDGFWGSLFLPAAVALAAALLTALLPCAPATPPNKRAARLDRGRLGGAVGVCQLAAPDAAADLRAQQGGGKGRVWMRADAARAGREQHPFPKP